MIKSILLIVSSAWLSFIYIDIESANMFHSLVLPLLFVLSLIALAIWFVAFFHKSGINQTDSSSGDSGGGFDSGGDC